MIGGKKMGKFMTMKGGHAGHNAPLIDNEQEEITPLYPSGTEEKQSTTMTEDQLRKLQDETDKEGILLPTELNMSIKRKYADDPDNDEIQPLLPTNI